VHVIIHHHISQQIIALWSKMLNRIGHNASFFAFEQRLGSSQTPSDKIGRTIHPPVREISAVRAQYRSLHGNSHGPAGTPAPTVSKSLPQPPKRSLHPHSPQPGTLWPCFDPWGYAPELILLKQVARASSVRIPRFPNTLRRPPSLQLAASRFKFALSEVNRLVAARTGVGPVKFV